MMNHQIILPPDHLKKWVRFFWSLDSFDNPSNNSTLKIFACRFPRLVFQHDNGHSAANIEKESLPISFFSGLHSKPNSLTFASSFSLTGVSFYPHAVKTIFGIDCHELTDEFPDIQSFAPKWLEERLLNVSSQFERIKIIGNFVYEMIQKNGKEDLLATNALPILNNSNNENIIQYLIKHYQISERQLERRFQSHIGFSPKQYLKITRFEKAVGLIITNNFQNLADIAYSLNYYDQTHFIKDFKAYSGYTPLAFYKQNKSLEEPSSMFVE